MVSLFPTYNRFDLAVKSAAGTIVEDIYGKKYLDFGTGIGVCNLGHRHPAVQKSIEKQLDEYWHLSNLYHMPIQKKAAKKITDNSPADAVFFAIAEQKRMKQQLNWQEKQQEKIKLFRFINLFMEELLQQWLRQARIRSV